MWMLFSIASPHAQFMSLKILDSHSDQKGCKKDQQIMCPAPATTSSPATFAQGEGLGVAPLGVSILLGVISRLGPNGSINITISAQSAKKTCTQTKHIKRCTGMYTYRHLQVIHNIFTVMFFSTSELCVWRTDLQPADPTAEASASADSDSGSKRWRWQWCMYLSWYGYESKYII